MPHLLLHVDDNHDDLGLLREAMSEADRMIRVESVASAAAAISFLADEVPFSATDLPDLIMIDIMMPVIDGVRLLQFIKETPAWSHIPVLMFTTIARSPEREACRLLGAIGYIEKPSRWNRYQRFASKLAQEIREGRLVDLVDAQHPADSTDRMISDTRK